MKTFDELYSELVQKIAMQDEDSGTVRLVNAGVHAVGKKVVEEAAESWMAAEFESKDQAADEIAQLLYHAQVLMLATGITLDDVYRRL
jgi:phosphoribosyl-ATP pyrophosphohydrolase